MVCAGNDSLTLSLSLSLSHSLLFTFSFSLSPSNSCLRHPHTCSISHILSHTQTHTHTHTHGEVMDSIWKHVFTSISSEANPSFRLFYTVRYHQSGMFAARQGIFPHQVLRFISCSSKPDLSASNSVSVKLRGALKMHPTALTTGGKYNSKSDGKVRRARGVFVLKVRAVPPLI